jgi:tetratricopeptide (TPR) repeat protein
MRQQRQRHRVATLLQRRQPVRRRRSRFRFPGNRRLLPERRHRLTRTHLPARDFHSPARRLRRIPAAVRSSNSSSGDASAGPLGEDDDAAAKAAAARKAERKRKASERPQTPSEREEEDLNVAEFYQNDRNYKGAYERATDAVSIAADDPNAHFALAEAARRLGKLDEAMQHYKACLALDPVPKLKKASEAALKQMAGG